MSHGLGRTIGEYLGWPGPVTRRQHQAALLWEEQERNRPSRDNFYQMRTTMAIHEVIRAFAGSASRLDLNDYRITIESKAEEPEKGNGNGKRKETADEATMRLMAGRPHHLRLMQKYQEEQAKKAGKQV